MTWTSDPFDDLAARNKRGCHVQEDRRVPTGRRAKRQRVGSDHRLPPSEDGHGRRSVGHGDRDAAFRNRAFDVIGSSPVVIGMSDGSDGNAAFLCRFDAGVHRLERHDRSRSVIAVNHKKPGRGPRDSDRWICLDNPFLNTFGINGDARDSVRSMAAQIGMNQDIGHDFGVLGGQSHRMEDAIGKRTDGLDRNDSSHEGISSPFIRS